MWLATPLFMSAEPAPIDAAVLDRGRPGIVAPSFPAADRDDVGVPVQEQRPPPARALQRRDDVRPPFVPPVDGTISGVLLELLPIRFPHVDVKAELRQIVRQKLLDLRLIAGDAGYRDHLLEEADRLLTLIVDLFEKLLADARVHLDFLMLTPTSVAVQKSASFLPRVRHADF